MARGGELLAFRELVGEKYSHSGTLTLFIGEVMQESGMQFSDLHAVAVSKGPGSYTGLRIGVSVAKGLCYGLEIPLIAVETLHSMARYCRDTMKNEPRILSPLALEACYCPMIDARRMEVYCSVYSASLEVMHPTDAVVVNEDTFKDLLENHKVFFFGDGAAKCQSTISGFNALFLSENMISARGMIPLALEKYLDNSFENTAYFEPFYLKDFVAGAPRVKGLTV